MILVELDEANVFDMLSILAVKKYYAVDHEGHDALFKSLKLQVTETTLNQVVSSDEYHALYLLNKEIFDLLEEITLGATVDARVIHELNMQRYQQKTSLQKRFFSSALTEKKST